MKDNSVFLKYNCIGILGGTFNPIHNGHIMLAQKAMKQFSDIEKIIILPNNKPAYKGTNEIISPKERIKLINQAVSSFDFCEVSDAEIKRGGITYTYDTLKDIYMINPYIKIYYIVGADSLFTIDKWHRYKDVLKMCTLLVAKRNSDYDDMKKCAEKLCKENKAARIEFIKSPNMNISSSLIRRFIMRNSDSFDKDTSKRLEEYLERRVPEKVKNYILKNRLYFN